MSDYSPLLQQGLRLVRQAADEDAAGQSREALKHYRLALEAFLAVIRTEKNQKIVNTVLPQVRLYMQRAEELQNELDVEGLLDSVEPPHTPADPAAVAPAAPPPKRAAEALLAGSSPFPPPPPQQRPQEQQQQQTQQQQQQQFSCFPQTLFSADQVTAFAKPPQTVPAAVVAETVQREHDRLLAQDFPSPPSQQQPQPQQQQQQQPQKPKQEENGLQRHTLEISDGERGFGPETLYGTLVTADTMGVRVADPALGSARQLRVLLRLCEVVLRRATGPVLFEVQTRRAPPPSDQLDIFHQLSAALHAFNRSRLVVTFAEGPITSSEAGCTVVFSNGARVHGSRGLDVYRTQDMAPWAVGTSDYELCPCFPATFEYTVPLPPKDH